MTDATQRDADLMQPAGFAIAHAVWCVSDDELLIPMMLAEVDGQRQLLRFKAERLEEGPAEGRRQLVANPDGAERAILVYDAYIKTDQGREPTRSSAKPAITPPKTIWW